MRNKPYYVDFGKMEGDLNLRSEEERVAEVFLGPLVIAQNAGNNEPGRKLEAF